MTFRINGRRCCRRQATFDGWRVIRNVRELTNRIVQACTLAERSVLQAGDIFPEMANHALAEPSLSRARAEAEKEEIERVIAECGGRIGEAAKKLGISRTTLWKRRRAGSEPTGLG